MGEPGRDGATPRPLYPWQRLAVRLAALLSAVAVLAVAAVGVMTYERHRREVEDGVGTQLLNIARVAALLVDADRHAEALRSGDEGSQAYQRTQAALVQIQNEVLLTTPIRTLADLDPAGRTARLGVVSGGDARSGERQPLAPEMAAPLAWTFEDGVARYTGVYRQGGGSWISAFAPIVGRDGRPAAVLAVDYPVEIYLDRLHELRRTVVQAALAGGLGALLLGLLAARRLTRPISLLTAGVRRVAGGDLGEPLAVRSADEVGQLTRAFNGMLEGLRQRDFIRSAFGRYVSPEVARALLDSPEGLRLGGHKRVVTVLMSDLRGYTQFAERGDPAAVMEVLNRYLARMTDSVIAHGGTINEFIGDAVFAVFGAPLDHPDHAERAAAAALSMQRAMVDVNRELAAIGAPRFEMGIGINTGEAVVGNIGSEQRAKYSVVGSAVNVAARVEGATVGGQIFVTEATWEQIRDLAEAAPPITLQAKGLSVPLHLRELRAIRGRFAQSLPAGEPGVAVEVALPVECRIVEGKTIGGTAHRGVVRVVRGRELAVELPVPLAPLTNVRLRLELPALGRASGDCYGKVVSGAPPGGRALVRIRLTALAPADELLLAAAGQPPGSPASVAPPPA